MRLLLLVLLLRSRLPSHHSLVVLQAQLNRMSQVGIIGQW